MKRAAMFWRILWQLFGASRGRLVLALLAISSGAAICSALINIDLDASRKLTRKFRTLVANLIVAPPSRAGETPLADEDVMKRVAANSGLQLAGAAPYLYVAASKGADQVIVAGTWLDAATQMNPWWRLDGHTVASRSDATQCYVGRNAARHLGIAAGSRFDLSAGGQTVTLNAAAILTSGGSEDNQIFTNLSVAQELAGERGKIGVVQLRVTGATDEITAYASRLAAALPEFDVRPVRQLTAAEGALLARFRGLIFWTMALILALTTLGVLASMSALALERSRDVGLMKALGGSVRRIMRLFLTEAGALAVAGGTLGYLAGILLARWIGMRVFGVGISPRLEVLPITIALMLGVALAGALPLRLLGRVRPAEILRGE